MGRENQYRMPCRIIRFIIPREGPRHWQRRRRKKRQGRETIGKTTAIRDNGTVVTEPLSKTGRKKLSTLNIAYGTFQVPPSGELCIYETVKVETHRVV
jgi:hypothetical protein